MTGSNQNKATVRTMRNYEVSSDKKGFLNNLSIDDKYAEQLGIDHPFTFWFRPEPLRQTVAANYNKMSVIGMSHQYHSFAYTENVRFTFDLFVNRLMMFKTGALQTDRREGLSPTQSDTQDGQSEQLQYLTSKIEQGRRYLEALVVPPETPFGIVGGAPPPCLLVVPGIVSLRCRLMGVEFEFSESDKQGNITQMVASCTFEEAPLDRFTMQDVLERGSYRSWGLS